jgi:hypothetical protein
MSKIGTYVMLKFILKFYTAWVPNIYFTSVSTLPPQCPIVKTKKDVLFKVSLFYV